MLYKVCNQNRTKKKQTTAKSLEMLKKKFVRFSFIKTQMTEALVRFENGDSEDRQTL